MKAFCLKEICHCERAARGNLFFISLLIFFFSVNAIRAEDSLSPTSYPLLPTSYCLLPTDLQRNEVERFRQHYLLPQHSRDLFRILDNGEQYRYYVHRRLLEEKLPLYIEFIPVIESSYKPLAMPKDGRSVGLWQFMENSIANYLRKTKWFDERRDPWKSTDAALKKLKANYDMFGDWLLAIAAYNCGAGAVSRALKKTSEKTFWSLAEKRLIPEHAINYVPRLLAISDIVVNKKIAVPEFSFDNETYSPLDDFDYIETTKSVSIKALAMELRIDVSILERLNPALLHGITPPNEIYEIRLPLGMRAAAEDALLEIASRY